MLRRMLMIFFLLNFFEEGSNVRRFEIEIYELFLKYIRFMVSG